MDEPIRKLDYLFRHALLRDAAYELQLPADKARLHGLALKLIEHFHPDEQRDQLAAELAEHAQRSGDPALREALLAYTWRAAKFASAKHDPAALHWFDQAAALETDPAKKAQALQLAADQLLTTGSAKQAGSRLAQALELAAAAGDAKLQAAVIHKQAVTQFVLGGLTEAESLLNGALVLARESGDPETEAMAITNMAGLQRMRGKREEAFALQKQALDLYRASGNRRGESVALGNICVYLSDVGQPQEALACADEAIKVATETDNRRTAGIVRGNVGMILNGLGRLAEAEASYAAALTLHQSVYNRPYEAYDRCRYALVLLRRGNERAARDEWRRGYEMTLAYGDASDREIELQDMRQTCAQAGVAPFDDTIATA